MAAGFQVPSWAPGPLGEGTACAFVWYVCDTVFWFGLACGFVQLSFSIFNGTKSENRITLHSDPPHGA